MGLVDYSDSDSDSEPVAKPAPPSQSVTAPGASGKKPFQKVVDRAKPGKILVNLPQSSSSRDKSKLADGDNEPPPKRTRVTGRGGAFSSFNSFLPPPKNVGKPAASSSSGKPAPRPGINLKTGATPGFSREMDGNEEGGSDETSKRGEDANSSAKQPSIPAEQKPADEVKLVGKPLMFKPLSVSRKPGKKSATKASKTAITTCTPPAPQPSAESQSQSQSQAQAQEKDKVERPPKRQKISLFSISDDPETEAVETTTSSTGIYEPMFSTPTSAADDFAAYDAQFAASHSALPPQATPSSADTLDSIAADMNLSAAARRELFGRGGDPSSSSGSRVVRFDTDREYAHNEALRAAGQLQPTYNPVRSIAPGKHSLRQLVTQVQSQRDALEESFAKGHGNRKEASAKYGW
ncbi:mitotic checkpoint regulator, MAD2B-interacting-domain-containing protein [Daldinia decipiens]|uniref:mitotic checkpoint regulator, MAD2B-interacting-domain-containing protein n=1 Tax=Daldinia decipiens TaxID=326647 RepID=UPI0020C1E809|nr:mitotic checkpoint regulator, MAD2B-interacting-domain-containing protein [Daldinia decipiens]KAI1661580.1 mitotic checkpoint regulator, MAD2B-interacting-domain-containing protein [Daldinia decipiens]